MYKSINKRQVVSTLTTIILFLVITLTITPVVASNTSLLAVNLNVTDFAYSSDTYVEGIKINFTTTESNTNLTLMSTMNIQKLSGAGTNEVWVKVSVNDAEILEEELRTVSKVLGELDEGSSGTRPVIFNVSNGVHNLTYEFKRTGNGAVEINDVDVGLLQFITTTGNETRAQLTDANFTHSLSSFNEEFRWNINKTTTSDTFIIGKFTVQANAETILHYYYKNLENNLVSPLWKRYISGSSNVGSVSGVYIDSDTTNSSINQSIFSSTTAGTAIVNGTILDFDLNNTDNDLINHFRTSNLSTNITNSITLSTGTHLLASRNVTIYNGTGYFLAMTTSFNSTTGPQTPVYFINSSDLPDLYSKKERFLRSDADVGNAFIYYVYNGTTIGENYTFNLCRLSQNPI